MDITLREVTKKNFEAVCDLKLPDEQQDFLAPNVWSLLESHYYDTFQTRAIYLCDEPVGFFMAVHVSPVKVSICRFMIAYEHQRKGVGRKSLQLAIDEAKRQPGIRELEICYSPDNVVAKKLYLSEGFSEVGMDDENKEMIAVIEFSNSHRS